MTWFLRHGSEPAKKSKRRQSIVRWKGKLIAYVSNSAITTGMHPEASASYRRRDVGVSPLGIRQKRERDCLVCVKLVTLRKGDGSYALP